MKHAIGLALAACAWSASPTALVHAQDAFSRSTEKQEKAEEEVGESLRMHMSSGAPNQYFFRGLLQSDKGFIWQSNSNLDVALYDTKQLRIITPVGFWFSVQPGDQAKHGRGPAAWYESRLSGGLALENDFFRTDARLIVYSSPNGSFRDVYELNLVGELRDDAWWVQGDEATGFRGVFPVAHPRQRSQRRARRSRFGHLHGGPARSARRLLANPDLVVDVVLPAALGMSLHDYYQLSAAGSAGTQNHTLGYASAGVMLDIAALFLPRRLGHVSVLPSLEALLPKAAQDVPRVNSVEFVAQITLSCASDVRGPSRCRGAPSGTRARLDPRNGSAESGRELAHDGHQGLARVAEHHHRVGLNEQLVLDAAEAGAHAALEHDHRARLLDVEHGHAVDRALRVGLRGRIHDVVRADDQRDVGLAEVVVDVVEVEQLVVGHVRLGEQHVHVTGHAAGDRVDRVVHRRAALLERLREVAHRVLRLRDGHAVARHHDDRLRRLEQLGGSRRGLVDVGVGGRRRPRQRGRRVARRCRTRRTARSQNERFIALLIMMREQETRRAVERARDDEDVVVEREARRRRGETGVRVEQRDDDRHVRAADRQHEQDAEQRGPPRRSPRNTLNWRGIDDHPDQRRRAPRRTCRCSMTFWPGR